MPIIESVEDFIRRKNAVFEKQRDDRKPIRMKDIGGDGYHCYMRVHWTFVPQCNNTEKVFVVERLALHEVQGKTASKTIKEIGDIEYRIAYYIVGKNGHLKNKWAWGQFCPMIPHKDFESILAKAKQNGTILVEEL